MFTVQLGDGYSVTCGSADDVVALIKALKHSRNGHGTMPATSARAADAASKTQSIEQKIDAVFAGINDNAKALLTALVAFPDGVESTEFGTASGINSSGFGGILGSISKVAKKSQLSVNQLVLSEARFDGKRRFRWLGPTKLLMENKDRL